MGPGAVPFGKAVIMIFSNLGLQVDTAATEDYSKVYFRPGEDSVWPEVACACVTGLPFLKFSDVPPVRSYHMGIVHCFVHELLDDGMYCCRIQQVCLDQGHLGSAYSHRSLRSPLFRCDLWYVDHFFLSR